MIYTNKLNLSEAIVNSVKDSKPPVKDRYSVTELLSPTRQIQLTRKYYDKIEVDVSDCVNTLFGTVVHSILEENASEDVETEIKMEIDFEGVTLVGKFDVRDLKNLEIEDYKTGKVSTVMKQDFEEYKTQGLAYAWMTYLKTGVIIRNLKIDIFLKDWSKIKAAVVDNYPQTPIYVYKYKIEDSDYDYIRNLIKNKIRELKSEKIMLCSDKDRWYTGTNYAVYRKVGDKRAALVTDNEQEAHNFITNQCNGTGEIQVRRGEYLRCQYYCSCNKFCEQWKGGN